MEHDAVLLPPPLAAALAAGRMGWWRFDLDADQLQWAPELGPLFGLPLGTAAPPSADAAAVLLIHEADREAARAQFTAARLNGDGIVQPFRVAWPDGSLHWLETSLSVESHADGTPKAYWGIARDVTPLQAMLKEREAAAARVTALLDGLANGIVIREGPELRVTYFNAAALRLLGLSPEDVPAFARGERQVTSFDEAWHPLPLEETAAARTQRTRQPTSGTFGTLRADGSHAWIVASAVPFKWPDRPLSDAVLVSIADISPLRETQEALRASEARHRRMTEASRDVFMHLDAAFRIVYVSAIIAEYTGWHPEALLGHDIIEYLHGDDVERVLERRRIGMTGQVTSAGVMTIRFRCIDGGYRWMESNNTALFDDHGAFTGLVATMRDVTERLRLDEQLRWTSKLQAVGTLAGSVAHDFNNLLTIVHGSAQLLQESVGDRSDASEDLGAILEAAEHGQALVGRLLSFTRQHVEQPTRFVVDAEIQRVAPMLARALGPGQSLALDLHAGDATVEVDRNEFEVALVNLLANARDAMGERGVVRIATDMPSPSAEAPAALVQADMPIVRVRIVDQGPGFSRAALEHLFEPFFTSKPLGKGTGLGLASVYGLLQRAGGGVTVQNGGGQPDNGATVALWLPAQVSRAPSERTSLPDPKRARRNARVLIVDDEAAVLHVVGRILERAGYTVETAMSGAEALERVARSEPAVDALLTDYAMPAMSGLDVVRELQRSHPQLPCAIMSAYAADEAVRDALPAVAPFLAKPFTVAEVLDILDALLGGR